MCVCVCVCVCVRACVRACACVVFVVARKERYVLDNVYRFAFVAFYHLLFKFIFLKRYYEWKYKKFSLLLFKSLAKVSSFF